MVDAADGYVVADVINPCALEEGPSHRALLKDDYLQHADLICLVARHLLLPDKSRHCQSNLQSSGHGKIVEDPVRRGISESDSVFSVVM